MRLPLPVKITSPRASPLKLTVRCTACRHPNVARLNLALIAGRVGTISRPAVWSQQIRRCAPSFSPAANPCRGQDYIGHFAGRHVDRPSLQNTTPCRKYSEKSNGRGRTSNCRCVRFGSWGGSPNFRLGHFSYSKISRTNREKTKTLPGSLMTLWSLCTRTLTPARPPPKYYSPEQNDDTPRAGRSIGPSAAHASVRPNARSLAA